MSSNNFPFHPCEFSPNELAPLAQSIHELAAAIAANTQTISEQHLKVVDAIERNTSSVVEQHTKLLAAALGKDQVPMKTHLYTIAAVIIAVLGSQALKILI